MSTIATPDLRRLAHFVAVVDAGGFTRAAERLHLSQQALSNSVQQLEREIGAVLLRRSGRRVTPTRAGQTLLDEGRVLLAAAATVTAHTRAAAAEHPAPFVIGHSPAISGAEVFTLLAPAIAAAPEVSFTVCPLFPDRLRAGLGSGEVQLGLRRGIVAGEQLAAAVARYDPLRVALPAGHRLAARPRITIAELADEPIALWAPPGSSDYSDFLVNACRRAGFEPRWRVSRVQGCPPESAALTEDAAAFVTAPAGPAIGGAVHVVELADPPLVPLQALWLPHTVSPVRELILTATGGAGARATPTPAVDPDQAG